MDAIPVIDECMSILALSAFRPINIRCPHAEQVSSDEYELAMILQSVQRDDHADATGRAATILAGRFSTTYIRVVRDNITLLSSTALSFSGVRALALVH